MVSPDHGSCDVMFGAQAVALAPASRTARLALPVPVLAGDALECLLAGASTATQPGGGDVFESGGRVAGFAVASAGLDLERATHDLYARMFASTAGRRLYRIWNYVPHINREDAGLENYRRFCRARAEAFERRLGAGFERHLPAASAVGMTSGPLAIAFLGGEAEPRHFENPRQMPAFAYPPDHGPRSPSFSRATAVAQGSRRTIFISGTAAIRGHLTIAPDDLAGQLACTRENLAAIAEAAGAGADLGARDGWGRTVKVYVRRAADLAPVRRHLETELLSRGDHVTYLHADLCRRELLVEIEAIITREA